MKLPRRQFLHLAAGAAALPAVSRDRMGANLSVAADHDDRAVSGGGPTDTVARIMAERMRVSLGQTVIIENVGGAGGSIGDRPGRARGARRLHDHRRHLDHACRQRRDLRAAVRCAATISSRSRCSRTAPLLIVAKKDMPANRPEGTDRLAEGESRQGVDGTDRRGRPRPSARAVCSEETGTRFQFVPYRGVGPAMQDLVAGQIDMTIANRPPRCRRCARGKIKAYAVTAKDRIASAPEIPTVDEAGLPGFYVLALAWVCWRPRARRRTSSPSSMPRSSMALADPACASDSPTGHDIPPREQQTPEALGAFHKAEIEKWWPIIKAAGIKAE